LPDFLEVNMIKSFVSSLTLAIMVACVLGCVYFGHYLTVTAQGMACPNPITVLEN
jgi:hypothetical protein